MHIEGGTLGVDEPKRGGTERGEFSAGLDAVEAKGWMKMLTKKWLKSGMEGLQSPNYDKSVSLGTGGSVC